MPALRTAKTSMNDLAFMICPFHDSLLDARCPRTGPGGDGRSRAVPWGRSRPFAEVEDLAAERPEDLGQAVGIGAADAGHAFCVVATLKKPVVYL